MPADWFKKKKKKLAYCYLRVSASKYLDFEERAGEREENLWCGEKIE